MDVIRLLRQLRVIIFYRPYHAVLHWCIHTTILDQLILPADFLKCMQETQGNWTNFNPSSLEISSAQLSGHMARASTQEAYVAIKHFLGTPFCSLTAECFKRLLTWFEAYLLGLQIRRVWPTRVLLLLKRKVKQWLFSPICSKHVACDSLMDSGMNADVKQILNIKVQSTRCPKVLQYIAKTTSFQTSA